MASPYIIENDRGDRLQLQDGAWVPLPNARAPGAAYLGDAAGKPDKSEAAYFNKFRQTDDPGLNGARSGVAQARRMEGLLAKQKTGGVYSIPMLGSVVGAFDPEIREMDALQSEAARSKRQPGEGAISDFDAKQFLAMTYGKDKPTETNRAIIQAQRLADDSRIQRRQFMEWHYNTYGKASGAEEAWDRYAQDNPIFDPASQSEGAPRLNTGRQNWRQYFGSTRGPGDGRGTQAETDTRRASGAKPDGWTGQLPKPQLAAAKLYAGAKGQGGTRANPFVPSTAEEFDGLPPGSAYIDTDGRVKTKRN